MNFIFFLGLQESQNSRSFWNDSATKAKTSGIQDQSAILRKGME